MPCEYSSVFELMTILNNDDDMFLGPKERSPAAKESREVDGVVHRRQMNVLGCP